MLQARRLAPRRRRREVAVTRPAAIPLLTPHSAAADIIRSLTTLANNLNHGILIFRENHASFNLR
jgi:hypothetical protein